MRYFEIRDAKSSKFWQIEQNGSDLDIRWGKIGTNGQSQTKSFADEAKAKAAMDKLIKEKTSKGYEESGENAPAMPAKTVTKDATKTTAPIAQKTAAEPEPVNEEKTVSPFSEQQLTALALATPKGETPPWLANGEPLSFSEKDLEFFYPSQRFPGEPVSLDAKSSFIKLRQALHGKRIINYAETESRLHAGLKEALERLENRKIAGSFESDVALFLLCTSVGWGYSRDEILQGECARFLVAQYSLEYALDVLLAAEHYGGSIQWNSNSRNREYSFHTCSGDNDYLGNYYSPFNTEEITFRTFLAQAEEEVWQRCAEKLQQAVASLPLCRQPLIAFMLPELPELAHQIAQNMSKKQSRSLEFLLLAATHKEVIDKLNKLYPAEYASFNPVAIATLIKERGVHAVEVLAHHASHESVNAALVKIGVPEAISALAKAASGSKTALTNLNSAMTKWPMASIPALAELAANGKDNLASSSLLLLLPNYIDALPALLPWLGENAKQTVLTLVERCAGPKEVADAAELPAVLVSPPWLSKKKKQTVAAMTLDVLPLDPVEQRNEAENASSLLRLHFTRSERVKISDESDNILDQIVEKLGIKENWSNKNDPRLKEFFERAKEALKKEDSDAMIAVFREFFAAYRNGYHSLNFYCVAVLPDEFALALWNQLSNEHHYGDRYVLAKYGLNALPGLVANVRAHPVENIALAMPFGAVELAPVMARAYYKLKTVRGQAQTWLLHYPEHAIHGLLPAALGKACEERDCAVTALRLLAENGHKDNILAVAAGYQDEKAVEATQLFLDEDPLDRFPAKIQKLPAFWQPAVWRRPVLKSNGKALPDSALEYLGNMLTFPATEGIYAGIEQVKAFCTPQSLADFAWDCFSAWLTAASPSKENWAFQVLGYFGTDETARKLTPYIRQWPGESQHQRAVAGLEILNRIGTDVALMLLNGIAQKVKFKGLQDKAREKIAEIAEARELSVEELEDRLAPDLGLNEQGSLLLDFGPRQFNVGFDEALKPYVRDMSGTRLKDLPKPNKSDDETLSKDAVNRYKTLKKDVKTIAAQQVVRFEVSMCQRRRWTPDLFFQLLVNHPLVRHVVQRLVWGVYQSENNSNFGGKLLTCFRVSEDGTLTTAQDDEFTLPAGDNIRIGVPHALELPLEQTAAFGQLFADYELLQPFAQLGRETYVLTEAEKAEKVLKRWNNKKVPTGRVLGLVNKGWRRGEAQDGGGIWYFIKPIDNRRDIELNLDPGIIVGMVDEYPEQTLGDILISEAGQNYWQREEKRQPFGSLDDIILSELIRDMEALCG